MSVDLVSLEAQGGLFLVRGFDVDPFEPIEPKYWLWMVEVSEGDWVPAEHYSISGSWFFGSDDRELADAMESDVLRNQRMEYVVPGPIRLARLTWKL